MDARAPSVTCTSGNRTEERGWRGCLVLFKKPPCRCHAVLGFPHPWAKIYWHSNQKVNKGWQFRLWENWELFFKRVKGQTKVWEKALHERPPASKREDTSLNPQNLVQPGLGARVSVQSQCSDRKVGVEQENPHVRSFLSVSSSKVSRGAGEKAQ